MHVVLDTNVLIRESTSSRNMQLLLRLRRAQFLSISIPALARREYLANTIAEAKDKLGEGVRRLESVARRCGTETEVGRYLFDVLPNLNRRLEVVERQIVDQFDAWAQREGIQILDFDAADIGAVLNDYFEGGAPFRAPRRKEDLLDAMFMASIRAKAEESELTVVVQDNVFRESLDRIPGVRAVETVATLLGLAEVAATLEGLDREEAIQSYKHVLESDAFKRLLVDRVLGDVDLIDALYVDGEIAGTDLLELDVFGLQAEQPDAADIEVVHLDRVDYLDAGRYAISTQIIAHTQIHYCADYADYLDLSLAREAQVSFDSMSHGICDLSERRKILFNCTLFIQAGATNAVSLDDMIAAGRISPDLEITLAGAKAIILPHDRSKARS